MEAGRQGHGGNLCAHGTGVVVGRDGSAGLVDFETPNKGVLAFLVHFLICCEISHWSRMAAFFTHCFCCYGAEETSAGFDRGTGVLGIECSSTSITIELIGFVSIHNCNEFT